MWNSAGPILPHRSPSRRAGRGQIAVMSLFYLIMMIYTAGMFVNVTQAVTRKVEAQMICDAAAFTGATYQAKGLNALTKTNRIIGGLYATYWTVGTLSGVMEYVPWPHKAIPAAIQGVFEAVINVFRLLADFQNIGYAGLAYSKAKENAEHNIEFFFDVTDIDAAGIKSYGGNYWCKDYPLIGKVSVDPILVAIPAAGIPVPALTADSQLLPYGASIKGDFYMAYLIWCWIIPCGYDRLHAEPPLWIKPNNKNEELRFYWVIQLPETEAMFMPRKWKVPPVTAVGSAKPFGGTRGPDDSDDMESVGKMSALGGLGSGDDGGEGFSPKYRARIAPTSTDFILHFYLFGPQYYKDNALLPSLWGGVLH